MCCGLAVDVVCTLLWCLLAGQAAVPERCDFAGLAAGADFLEAGFVGPWACDVGSEVLLAGAAGPAVLFDVFTADGLFADDTGLLASLVGSLSTVPSHWKLHPQQISPGHSFFASFPFPQLQA